MPDILNHCRRAGPRSSLPVTSTGNLWEKDLPRTCLGEIHHGLATALNILASRGQPVRAGMVFATGAITGIHPIGPGQRCRVDVRVDRQWNSGQPTAARWCAARKRAPAGRHGRQRFGRSAAASLR
jgi:hypothetical protein